MVAFWVSMNFVFGGLAAAAAAKPMVWAFGAMAFLFDRGEEIAKDILDTAGDGERNARWLVRIRAEASC